MTTDRRVLVHPDRATLAGSVAARFITKMIDLVDDEGRAHVVLTGGSVGNEVLEAIAHSPARDSLDWTAVHLWWGDERWVPRGDADRNETQARRALIDHLSIPAENVHPFAASDEGLTLDDAAARYADELRDYAEDGSDHPRFAILFLGVGPDGHVASLFPERPGPSVTGRTVIAVTDSPKPPAERLSLTMPVIRAAERVWLVLAGADKAPALGLALAGASPADVPAAGAVGTKRTVFFVDAAAATDVPESLTTPPSYWTGSMDTQDWSPSAWTPTDYRR